MIAAVLALLAMTVVGLPVTLAIDRNARGAELLGLAFLYGSGVAWAALLALSGHWSLTSVTIGMLLMASIAFAAERGRLGRWRSGVPAAGRGTRPLQRTGRARYVIDLATALTILGYGLFATIARLWEWDFWAIWGVKARLFFDRGGIDWRFLESRWNGFAHPDYPLLVPFNYDLVALFGGEWSDRWLGVLLVAWAAALLLIVRGLMARETTPMFAAAITFAVASLAVSRYLGLAEGALIAFSAAGILMLRRGVLDDDDAAWRHGAILLGLAANCKNEGLALIASVVIALLLAGAWRRIVRLWPAALIVAPWLILRATHTLATDIAGGSVSQRLMFRLRFVPQVLDFLIAHLYERWFWVAILAGLAIVPQALRARERFVLFVTATQLAAYVATYFATPHDARWHIVTSWPRLTGQLAVPVTVVVLLMLAQTIRRDDDFAHAEARPDER
jgi:hypothetical protein